MTGGVAWVLLVLAVWMVWGGEAVEVDVGVGGGVGVAENLRGVLALNEEDYPVYDDFPVDYHYADGDYIDYLPDLKNVTLRKCQCSGLQYNADGKCHNATDTYVIVVNPYSGDNLAVHTSDLGAVKVEPLTCPPNHRLVTLEYSAGHYFSLLVSGGIVWERQLFQEYCVIHTLVPETGKPETWQANVCVPPLPIPHCCPPQHALLRNGSCSEDSGSPALTPPVSLGLMPETEVVWHSESAVGSPVAPMSCLEEEEVLELDLGDRVRLMWDPYGLQLHFVPPMQHLPKLTTHFCLGVGTDQKYRARVCFKDPVAEHREKCRGVTCVRKCCREGHMFKGIQCVPVDNDTVSWQPEFYSKGTLEPGADPPADLTIIHGMPLCSSFFQLEPHRSDEDRFYLQVDGTLHVPNFQKDFPAEDYCLENFETENRTATLLPLICFEDQGRCKDVQQQAYPVLLAVSCIFLAITLLVYVSVPELHAKVHGKCLVSHVTALLLAYLSLIIVQRTTDTMPDVGCKVIASITHVSFLAAFFWLNVMCFDIWWTLKSMRPVAETGERSRLRFKMYSVYSWGCPILISLVATVVEFLPQEYQVIRPGFGVAKCWFDNSQSTWAYFYGFVLVLVVLNIVFFCWVAWILIMAQNDPILQRTRQQNRERMWLYVKLFLVMGLTWITEVISWQEGSCGPWIATDIINSLQGFSIFLIFICKRNMIKRIRANWEPYLRRVKELFGPSRPPPSTRQAVHDTSSFSSSSVHRPSQSNASQRTVQSQISLDPTTASRKLSTTSLGSLAGAPVHATTSLGSNGAPLTFSNSLSMDTITEATHQEAEEEEAAKQDQEGTAAQNQGEATQKQGQGDQSQGDDAKQSQGKVENEEQDMGKEQPSQEGDKPSFEPQTNDVKAGKISPEDGSSYKNNNNTKKVQRHPEGDPHDTEATELRSGRVSPSHVEIDMPSDSSGRQQNIVSQPGALRDIVENGAIKASEEMIPETTVKKDKVPLFRDSNSEARNRRDELTAGSDKVKNPAGEDPVGSKGVVECYNRAFTTDDDDDLPIEV